ncbi:unnamed protein product, partial [Staurois parvus]
MLYTVLTVPPSPPQRWRGCLLSAEESGPLLHLSPRLQCRRSWKTGSCKPELSFTMRLGAQVHRLPQRNFSSHLASGFFKP